jgi:hypothetical protein
MVNQKLLKKLILFPLFKWFYLDRVKDGKQVKNDRDAVIIKQDGNVHSLTVNGIKRGDSGTQFPI